MLYDPKWEQKTKADPLSLASLIAWLERHPADETYCYMDSGECLAAQYNQSIGRVYQTPNPIRTYFGRSFDAHLERIALEYPRNFGAALERARAIAR